MKGSYNSLIASMVSESSGRMKSGFFFHIRMWNFLFFSTYGKSGPGCSGNFPHTANLCQDDLGNFHMKSLSEEYFFANGEQKQQNFPPAAGQKDFIDKNLLVKRRSAKKNGAH